MKSIADGLPPEIAEQIHPDWRKNEADYWAVRDQLLDEFHNQWIGFSDGEVVASGKRPVVVLHAALEAAEHPFFICVGREDQPFRMRRAVFAYDDGYEGEALPVISAEFRRSSGERGVVFGRLIVDTGADSTTSDCQKLSLKLTHGVPAYMAGVAGGAAKTFLFKVWVYLDGKEYLCQIAADFEGRERILGRDVLNSLDVLLRGPDKEIVVNP